MTNTLAYCSMEIFTAVKSFMVLAHAPFLKMELTLIVEFLDGLLVILV